MADEISCYEQCFSKETIYSDLWRNTLMWVDWSLFLYHCRCQIKLQTETNVKEVRNDYVMTNAIINMLHINKSFALTILIEAKENIIKFIKSDFAYGDTNGEDEKYKFHQSLKKVENDILKLELTDEERDTLLNYDNYNLTHPEQKESK